MEIIIFCLVVSILVLVAYTLFYFNQIHKKNKEILFLMNKRIGELEDFLRVDAQQRESARIASFNQLGVMLDKQYQNQNEILSQIKDRVEYLSEEAPLE